MSKKIRPLCNKLFDGGDKVRATVLTTWIALRSKPIYAIDTPEECERVEHINCQFTKGVPLNA